MAGGWTKKSRNYNKVRCFKQHPNGENIIRCIYTVYQEGNVIVVHSIIETNRNIHIL